MTVSVFDDLGEMMRQIDALPPRVSCAYASHTVPFGRVYRMWTTRGEMIAYVNRGEIADLPRAVEEKPFSVRLLSPALWGVPVVVE